MANIVIWEVASGLDGGQRVSLDIYESLKDRHRCLFLVPGEGPLTGEFRKRGIPHRIVPLGAYRRGGKSLKDMGEMARRFPPVSMQSLAYIRAHGADLIYSNGARSFIWSGLVGSLLGIPVIWHVHNVFSDYKTRVLLQALGRMPSVKQVVCVSRQSRHQFPALAGKSRVIYNGVDIRAFNNGGAYEVRREFAIPAHRAIVAHLATIMQPKGQEVLLQAAPQVLQECPDTHFLLVGGVSQGYEDYYARLQGLVRELALSGHVTFTGFSHQVPAILKDVKVNTVNSAHLFESCPLVVLEAASLGVPTVGTDLGGTPELIRHGVTGLVYQPGNPDELARHIIRLLMDDGFYQKLGENCRQYVQEFSLANFTANIRQLVSQCLREEDRSAGSSLDMAVL
jgi:glycosyltransferase involved in cell wall biosynthesis